MQTVGHAQGQLDHQQIDWKKECWGGGQESEDTYSFLSEQDKL